MKFDIITIFPEIFENYFNCSILKKAKEKKIIQFKIHNLRDFTDDNHKIVDDKPFGGGRGMVMKIEPIFRAVSSLIKSKIQSVIRHKGGLTSFDGAKEVRPPARYSDSKKTKIILFTPRGKKFNQRMAYQFSKLERIIFICGRYEGVDERVAKHIADIELSIGDYVLMGGELPALAVMEAVVRLIPGVIGKPELLKQRITKEKNFIEYPQYTRPELFDLKKYVKNWQTYSSKFRKAKIWRAPKVLLSGDSKKIEEWRKKHAKNIGK
jgi:tRNA (guanine37-N1)-methyltransferase